MDTLAKYEHPKPQQDPIFLGSTSLRPGDLCPRVLRDLGKDRKLRGLLLGT